LLVWLLVAAYALHILEEWFGGFPEWLAVVAGAPLPRDAFVLINAVALAAMAAATRTATRDESRGWLAIVVAAILFANGLLHLLASVVTRTYSPGVITGVVFYLPLGQLALLRAWEQAPRPFFVRGILTALGLHAIVSVVAFGLSRSS
jgi:hypothetical protein